jgi:hypothetical protein
MRYNFTKGSSRSTSIVVIGVVILALIAIVAVWKIRSPDTPGEQQMRQVVSEVEKLMLLPTDESPTLATVQDKRQLENQAIFARAENGDKVLVYAKSQKVIVYRPSAHKIVDVGPIVLDKKGSPYLTAKVAIMDGSGKDNATQKVVNSLLGAFPNATIVSKDAAPRSFPETIVIDLAKNKGALNEELADTLGIKAGQLPLGVSAANADFLIIIGQDYKP